MPVTLNMTFQPYGSLAPFTIAVDSVSFDSEQTLNVGSQSTGAGAGKVNFNPFSFLKKPDIHSPEFFNRLCSGTPFLKVSLNAAPSPTGAPFFSFIMGLVAVKTLSFSDAGGVYPSEAITLEYGQAAYSVTPQNPDGSFGVPVASGWDRVKNVAIDPSKIGSA